jgi:hypothetical protein
VTATTELIKAVLALIGTARDDPHYQEKARGVLDLCKIVLEATNETQDEAREAAVPLVAPTTGPGNLCLRIAELAARGAGVREIARQLGVNASTVSRRLRRAQRAEGVARNT